MELGKEDIKEQKKYSRHRYIVRGKVIVRKTVRIRTQPPGGK